MSGLQIFYQMDQERRQRRNKVIEESRRRKTGSKWVPMVEEKRKELEESGFVANPFLKALGSQGGFLKENKEFEKKIKEGNGNVEEEKNEDYVGNGREMPVESKGERGDFQIMSKFWREDFQEGNLLEEANSLTESMSRMVLEEEKEHSVLRKEQSRETLALAYSQFYDELPLHESTTFYNS